MNSTAAVARQASVTPIYENDPLHELVQVVLDGLPSATSRRTYGSVLQHFLGWRYRNGRPEFNKASVQAYRKELEVGGLSTSSINVRMTAIRRLAEEALDNGLLDPMLAAGVAKVKGVKTKGTRMGNWLTQEQAQKLLRAPGITLLKGKRDTALLALFFGCGLRRRELAELTFEHIQQRDGRWVIVDLVGKGGRIRTVPIKAEVKAIIDRWAEAAGFSTGRVFRAINKGGHLDPDSSLTPQAVFLTVVAYAEQSGLSVRPHDLRRTFAKLTFKAGAPLEQIQISLGHASIQTTERYLGVRQDLEDAPCDRLKGLFNGLF